MNRAKRSGWYVLVGLVCSGVAACSGADVPAEPGVVEGEQELTKGVRCAGPRGLECAADQFCSAKPGKCPDAQQKGRCATRPDLCTQQFDPVCGCDGVTYGNACRAAAAGTSVASGGECPNSGAFCGGIAGFPCPQGQDCVDNPSDDCDPEMGGADCGGICVDASSPGIFCGGIANIQCPKGQECADAPGDGCSPETGGADCGGVCVDAVPVDPCASVRCKKGTECAVTPEGTAACLPTNNPCAAVLCPIGTECVAKGKKASCVPSAVCGEAVCAPGTSCCNPLRSICTPPGVFCIQ